MSMSEALRGRKTWRRRQRRPQGSRIRCAVNVRSGTMIRPGDCRQGRRSMIWQGIGRRGDSSSAAIVSRTHLHLPVEPVVEDQVVGHADAVGLHGVAWPVVVVSDLAVIVVGHLERWGQDHRQHQREKHPKLTVSGVSQGHLKLCRRFGSTEAREDGRAGFAGRDQTLFHIWIELGARMREILDNASSGQGEKAGYCRTEERRMSGDEVAKGRSRERARESVGRNLSLLLLPFRGKAAIRSRHARFRSRAPAWVPGNRCLGEETAVRDSCLEEGDTYCRCRSVNCSDCSDCSGA